MNDNVKILVVVEMINDSLLNQVVSPFNQIESIPYNTTDYANMCMEYLGVLPTVDCGEGVHIPIYVNGEVCMLSIANGCDDQDFKGTCNIGSRVARS